MNRLSKKAASSLYANLFTNTWASLIHAFNQFKIVLTILQSTIYHNNVNRN
jgi:hypothetical protein